MSKLLLLLVVAVSLALSEGKSTKPVDSNSIHPNAKTDAKTDAKADAKQTTASTCGKLPSGRRPNIIFIVTDEERAPVAYETNELKSFRRNILKGRERLKSTGVSFDKHYVASAACEPSRATMYTGQMPSLHGVKSTTGGAKHSDDPLVTYLEPGVVPTMGDWMTVAGYDTKYIGKWHMSFEDIIDEHGHTLHPSPITPDRNGLSQEAKNTYLQADKLAKFGWNDGWIGPEPHGAKLENSGWHRDATYVNELIEWVGARNRTHPHDDEKPFLLALNLVNPHDIVFANVLWWSFYALKDMSWPENDPDLPYIPPSPTEFEDLLTKPSVQALFVKQYTDMLKSPIDPLFVPDATYRKFYYWCHKLVDLQIQRVLNFLETTRFNEDTIIMFSSDHGEMLGSHGGLRQKWHNFYEETGKVPFYVSSPALFPAKSSAFRSNIQQTSSSIDILPTMLGFAGFNTPEAKNRLEEKLRLSHTEVHSLPGTDWSTFLKNMSCDSSNKISPVKVRVPSTVLFETEDYIGTGSNQMNGGAKVYPIISRWMDFKYDALQVAGSVRAVVSSGENIGGCDTWKYVRYYDNPALWTEPHVRHVYTYQKGPDKGKTTVKTTPVPEEYELYCLDTDPFEQHNLAPTQAKTTTTTTTTTGGVGGVVDAGVVGQCSAVEAKVRESASVSFVHMQRVMDEQVALKFRQRTQAWGPKSKWDNNLVLGEEWVSVTYKPVLLSVGTILLAAAVIMGIVYKLLCVCNHHCRDRFTDDTMFSGLVNMLRTVTRMNLFGNGLFDVLFWLFLLDDPSHGKLVFSSLSTTNLTFGHRLVATLFLSMGLPRLYFAADPSSRVAYVCTAVTYPIEMVMFFAEARTFNVNTPRWDMFAIVTTMFVSVVVLFGPLQRSGDTGTPTQAQSGVSVLAMCAAVAAVGAVVAGQLGWVFGSFAASAVAVIASVTVSLLSSSMSSLVSTTALTVTVPFTPPSLFVRILRYTIRVSVLFNGIGDLLVIFPNIKGKAFPYLFSSFIPVTASETAWQFSESHFTHRLFTYLCVCMFIPRIFFAVSPSNRAAFVLGCWTYLLEAAAFGLEGQYFVGENDWNPVIAVGCAGTFCLISLLFGGAVVNSEDSGGGYGGLSIYSHSIPATLLVIYLVGPPFGRIFFVLSVISFIMQLTGKTVNKVDPKDGYALVTGASKGIGAEMARVLAEKGYNLVLVARSFKELEELKDELVNKNKATNKLFSIDVRCVAQDLSTNDAATELQSKIDLLTPPVSISILINNAGASVAGPFSSMELNSVDFLLNLNLVGLTKLTALYLTDMLKKKKGRIMNVASVNGIIPCHDMAVYSASKSYVRTFTEALSSECDGSGVSVTCLIPGAVSSSFAAAANVHDSFGYSLGKWVPQSFAGYVGTPMSVSQVAREGVNGMLNGQECVVPGIANRFGAYILAGLLPQRIAMWLLKKFLS